MAMEHEPRNLPPERPGPRGGKRDQNRRARTKDLAEAGLALFLERGIGAVTVDDIARRAGVAKGSFYRYFRDQEDLVDALVEPTAARLLGAMEVAAQALREAGPRGLAAVYLRLAGELTAVLTDHPGVVRLYLQESRAPASGPRRPLVRLGTELGRRAVHLTEIATDAGLLRPIHPTLTALAVVGAAERLLLGYLRGEHDAGAAEVARALVTMVLDGMRPHAGEAR